MNSFDVLSGSSTRTTDSLNLQLQNANGQEIGGSPTAQVNTYTIGTVTANQKQANQAVVTVVGSIDPGLITFTYGGLTSTATIATDAATAAANLVSAVNSLANGTVAFIGKVDNSVVTTTSSASVTGVNTDGLVVGMSVTGTGIAAGTTIAAITTAGAAGVITLSAAITGTGATITNASFGGGAGGVTVFAPSAGVVSGFGITGVTGASNAVGTSLITPNITGNVGATVGFTYGTQQGSYVIGATAGATATALEVALDALAGTNADAVADTTAGTVTLTAKTAGVAIQPVIFTGVSANQPTGVITKANSTGSAISFGTNTGLDIVNLSNISGSDVLVSASATPGATTFRSNLSTKSLAFNDLTQGSTAYLKGNGTLANGGLTAGYVSTATSGAVVLEGGTTAGAINIIGAGLTSQTITSTGASNKVGTVTGAASATSTTIAATTNFEASSLANTGATLTVTGAGSAKLGDAIPGTVKTLNAAANSGGVTAVLNTDVAITVTGGTGNDTFTAGAVLTTGSVNAGVGTDDELIVDTNVSYINTATLAAKYTNFEVLNFGGTYDMSLLPGITAVKLSAASAVTNLTATQAANITTTSDTVATQSLALANANGTTDVVSINLGSGGTGGGKSTDITDTTNGLTVNGFETINLKANPQSLAAVGNDRTSLIGIISASTATAINLTGTAFDISNGATTKATAINASALTGDGGTTNKGLTLAGSLIADSSVVGSGLVDTFTIGAISSAYNGRAGSDVFNITQAVLNTSTAFTTIVGGDGSDTLNLTDTGTIAYADSNFTNVSGVEKFVLGTVTGTGTSIVAGTNLNQLATANGGVWDVAAPSIAPSSSTTTGSVTIDGSLLSAGNSLKANVKVAAGSNVVAATVITKIYGSTSGKDSITLATVAAATGSSGSFLVDAATNTAGVTINGSAMVDNLTASSTITFLGGSGADTITAAAVATSITGGANRDTITGGAGTDLINYTSAATSIGQVNVDSIINFTSGASTTTVDRIVLNNGVLAGVALTSSVVGGTTGTVASTTAVNSIADVYAAIASNASFSASSFAASGASMTNSIITFSQGAAQAQGSYLVVNDSVAGFQAGSDFVVQIANTTAFDGTLALVGAS